MFRLISLSGALASIFVCGFAVSHFHLAGPFAVWVRGLMPSGFHCAAAMENGICLGGSNAVTTPYEETVLANLPPPSPATVVADIHDFAVYLKRAVGWKNIPRSSIHCAPHKEAVKECFVEYGNLLRTRYLYRGGNEDKPLVIVMHGHVSTANKVMGLEPADYMREVGRILSDDGYSVAALDLTHGADTSARLNGQLVLHGIQLYGLWSRFACDVAKAFPDRKAVVYGLSNGGVIADHVSVLCHASNISLVFVDDILSDWREAFTAHPTIHARQNYALHYFAPLHYETSYLHFVTGSRVRKIYTRSKVATPSSLPARCLRDGPADGWQALLAPLAIDHHVAQIALLQEALATGQIENSRTINVACIEEAMTSRRTATAQN